MIKRNIAKNLALAWLGLALLSPAAAQQDAATAAPAYSQQNLLFVGNSLTMYNNAVYTHLRQLLVADDPAALDRVFTKTMVISGGLLSDHRDGLMQMLSARDWHLVVLQGHSREAVDAAMSDSFATTAAEYAREIRAQGGEPVLFMTWAYADKPEMSAAVAEAYTKLGRELGARVAPVGLAFARAIEQIPGVQLYVPDNIHPRLEGTYLAAAVFYASLFGKSPVELGYDAGLDEGLARQLRAAAWQTVRKYAANSPSGG